MPQRAIPAVLMRGGTSRGLFFHESDLPAPGPARDAVLLEAMGSPDPGQIDGLGGATSSTSKIMIVDADERSDVDVEYLFGQASLDKPVMDYRANCGNLTAAVAPFAIDEGLIGPFEDGPATVTLRNRNTDVRVEVHLHVHGGRAAVQGDHTIAGIPRPGAMIETRFLDPAGAVFGRLFPTGNLIDQVPFDGREVEATVLDVANPTIFVCASDLGIDGDVAPADVNGDKALLAALERLRGHVAVELGMVERREDADSVTPSLPTITLCAPSDEPDVQARVRVMSVQRMHHACPMSALMCAASAGGIAGTVVAGLTPASGGTFTVEHPKGRSTARAVVDHEGAGVDARVRFVGVTRTARRLMAGEVYVRA